MPTAWKRFLAVFYQFPSPLMNRGIGDAQLTSQLGDGFTTGRCQSHCFFFEFSRVGFLSLCHDASFPNLLEYISALLTLPNWERLTNTERDTLYQKFKK